MTDCSGCHNLRWQDDCYTAWPSGRLVCKAGHIVYRGENGPETDGPCDDRQPTREFVLAAKFGALDDTAKACGIGDRMYHACNARMASGHREHGDDMATLDTRTEACEELLDFINYAALARMQGRWSWRWRIAGWLVGLAWRIAGWLGGLAWRVLR